jgi:hypothetical protein
MILKANPKNVVPFKDHFRAFGDAEVAALVGLLKLAADALDLILIGAGLQRRGDCAQRAEAWRGTNP